MNENFGSEVTITGEVKYVGEGENPEDNMGFQIWKNAFKSVYGQPERSKREDSCANCFELEKACGNSFSQDGLCPDCGRKLRCGALNSMET